MQEKQVHFINRFRTVALCGIANHKYVPYVSRSLLHMHSPIFLNNLIQHNSDVNRGCVRKCSSPRKTFD